jgi:nucleotide-binding universal stress UspA family protein
MRRSVAACCACNCRGREECDGDGAAVHESSLLSSLELQSLSRASSWWPANSLLEFAFAAASERRAPLRAVRAWNLPPLSAYRPESLRLLDKDGGIEAHERKVLAEAVRPWREKFPDVRVTEHVEIGSGAEVLLSASSEAVLLVVGRRTHRPLIATRLGHVAHAALHHARCPVAIVPHD